MAIKFVLVEIVLVETVLVGDPHSVLNSMYRSGLVDTFVTHAKMKGLGLIPLFGDRRGFMPPQLKTKHLLYMDLELFLYIKDKVTVSFR